MARSYFRPNVEAMSAYQPGEQPWAGARVTKLNTNENPYPPSPKALEALAAAGRALRLYPDPTSRELRQAAGRAFGFEPDWVIAGNGSDELLSLLVRAIVPEGGAVAYPVPTYSLYRTLARMQAAEAVEFPWADGWAIPEGLAGAGARLVFLARPNSPTGTVAPVGSVRDLAGRLGGAVLCIDEAYADFADDDCLGLVREFPNVIALRTLSKSFSLAGARVGLGFARPELIAGLGKIKDSYNLSRPAQAAGAAALGDMDWMRANANKVRATRARLVARLAGLGVACPPSQANFVFARVGSPRARELYLALKARGILVRHFDEDGLRDGLRISVGTDAEVDELLSGIEDELASTKG